MEVDGPGGGEASILAYSGGISNSATTHTGGGGAAGKANFQDISVSMVTSKISAAFLKSVAMGTHFPEMRLKFYSNSKKLYYQITIQNVIVTSVSFGSSCGSNPCADQTENVTFNFPKIKWEDFINNTSFGYNIAANTQL
ncbi:MAG: type VI secretion system tube protein Hcp [Chitinophagaceae bacterium]|nr:type VI secretion system tube protein Hcp [Chitinophagaceae bacterium]